MKPDREKTTPKAVHITRNARNTIQFCALLAAAILLSACQREAKVARAIDPFGVYTLTTVNGDKVPAKISHEGVALEVRSGTFTIEPNGTCTSKVLFVPPTGSAITREVTATYTLAGSTLSMQWKGAGRTTGTVEGNTFTMNNEGTVFAYKK